MNATLKALTEFLPGPLGTVLHIGAGAQAVDDYASVEFRQLILVEGDADAHAELAAEAQRSGRNIRVRKDVVAAEAGPLLWHRHSVRNLNGPHAADGLTSLYPRLRLLGTLPVPGTAIASLLAEVAAEPQGEAPDVLVLDVPGQELSLLEAIPDDLLLRFAWVCFRGSRATQVAGWSAPGHAAEALTQRDYVCVASTTETNAVWPVHIHRFDLAGRTVKQLGKQAAGLEERCRQAEAALATAKDELSRERAELVRLSDRLREQEMELQRRDIELTALRTRSGETAREDDARVAELQRAVDEALAHQRAQAEELSAAKAAAAAQVQALLEDRQRQDEQVALLQRERDEALQQAQAETALRDAAVEQAREAAAQMARVEQSLAVAQEALDASKTDLAAQVQALLEDRQRQDEQVALLQRERDEALQQAQAETALRDAAVEQAREAAAQMARVEQSLAVAQEALDASKTDLARAEEAHQQRVAGLEDEIEQLQLRQRLLDEEVIKAEGQIELIKDVLLRESSL